MGIDTTSVDIALQNWSGGLWGDDVSATYLTGTTSITTSTGVWIFEGIPYGKYRYTVTVRDLRGNSSVVSNDFYIDEIEWNISQPSVDIGTLPSGITKTSSPDELILTIQTVGAPFRVTMSGTSLQYASSSIPHWTGT